MYYNKHSNNLLPNNISIVRDKDIFSSNMKVIVNPVNCEGIIETKLNKQFKLRYPHTFNNYKERCYLKEIEVGNPCLYRSTRWIINFPIKYRLKDNSNMDYINEGLENLVILLNKWDIDSIAIPVLGNNKDKLNWGIIKDMIINRLSHTDIVIEIYEHT